MSELVVFCMLAFGAYSGPYIARLGNREALHRQMCVCVS